MSKDHSFKQTNLNSILVGLSGVVPAHFFEEIVTNIKKSSHKKGEEKVKTFSSPIFLKCFFKLIRVLGHETFSLF